MIRKKLPYLLTVVLLLTLLTLPTHGADNRYRIAVLPFDDGSIHQRWWGQRWEVGKGVSDQLVTELLRSGKFRLVEREQLERILREQNLALDGKVDSFTAARIGKLLGVHYLVMGRVTEFSTNSKGANLFLNRNPFGLNVKVSKARVAIDARLVDATTAEIKYAVTGEGEKKDTQLGLAINWDIIGFGSNEFNQTNLGAALRDAVVSVSDQLSEKVYGKSLPSAQAPASSGFVADLFEKKVYITLGASDGLQPGDRLIVHHVVRTVKNPQTEEVIDTIMKPIAELEVLEVKERSAVCRIAFRLNRHYDIEVNDPVKQVEETDRIDEPSNEE